MVTFGRSDELEGAEFVDVNLRGARFDRSDLSGVVMRGVDAAWAALEQAWAPVLERVAGMPPGTVDVSVRGEWSFAQTLRHLVMATDVWLRRAIPEVEEHLRYAVRDLDAIEAGAGS